MTRPAPSLASCLRAAAFGGALAGTVAAAQPAAAWTLTFCADPDAAPFSRRDGSGSDNRIAALVAAALGAELQTVWLPDHRARSLRRQLQAGECDLAMGVLDGQKGFLTSHAYYRTGYVFVARSGAAMPASLDDPALADLRVGLADDPAHPAPPTIALAKRGHLENLRHFPAARLEGAMAEGPVRALKAGEIDLAILWGPVAGPLVAADAELALSPVTPEIDMPFIPMVGAFTIGTRPDDVALRDAVDHALAQSWDAVQEVLAEAQMPLLPLAPPRLREAMR
ncbi:transporter substrate-binding domain-containing protein [Paracoccus tibetensis]|uniref:ABC-type amino acid transport substrate-binding protein n=1 Tax=Paracoccus tibetensis TaxID=336292 RepID=A0A1G5C5V0_9RHOB|nr:transporter substrate-binding domain-containing protein [Paracoccus tibetensis]SCX97690.1 ABC-type amino acid transport substrate-binding protein [Paracoccus tibetensis]